jgi:hypothetical protein
MWGALFDERTGLSFTIAAGPRSRVRVLRDSWPHFTVSDSRLPHPGGPGLRIYIPKNMVGRLYPPALGSTYPNLEDQVPVFISPRTWWPSYTPRHWVPFPSPPTTRRVTVEVFEPASTRHTMGSNWLSLTVLLITSRHEPHRKHRSSSAVFSCCHANLIVFEAVTQ